MEIARSKSGRILAAIILLILGGLPGYFCVYQPIKFGYITRRIESAKTAAEERSALELAKRWGDVWEILVTDLDSGEIVNNQEKATSFVNNPAVRHLSLELEWMETKYPSGVPYRAKRTLIDKQNLYLFFGNPPA